MPRCDQILRSRRTYLCAFRFRAALPQTRNDSAGEKLYPLPYPMMRVLRRSSR